MTKLRIAWLTQYPLYTLGNGLVWARRRLSHPSSWIVSLARALGRREAIELHLITLCPWVRGDQTVAHPDGYMLHVLDSGIPFLHRGFPGYAPLDALTGYRMERRQLVAKVGQVRPDVVHAHGTEYAYGLAAMDANYPWVVSLQGIIADYLRTNPSLVFKLVAPLEKQVLRGAKFIGGRTHFDKGYAAKVNSKAVILDFPEAMNECFFSGSWKDPGNRRILFVGSGEEPKGLHHLIDALGRL
ncbi:MAG: glycosyltransferase, partial [bacterium]